MNVLAVVGSARKGKSTDTLVDCAIEGAQRANPDCTVTKLYLYDRHIEFCRNCLACRDSKDTGPVARCSIRDDMDEISQDLIAADALLFGTPLHMGFAPGIVTTFLERICWTFAKPERRILTINGCPIPRQTKTRRAAIIITNGIVPPFYRRFCDRATELINCIARDSLNAKTIGSLYAGDIEHRGLDPYRDKANRLGARLVG